MRPLGTRVLPALAALLLLAPFPAAADETPTPTVTVVEGMLAHGGRQRAYRLMTRSDHDKAKPMPLVLALHGGGGTAEGFDDATNHQFAAEVKKRGWLVVFPQGVAKGWNDGRPLTSLRDRQRRGVDDVAFLGALIDHLHATHGVDRSRVYATGISNGGFMSFRLGLELSDKLAAIAPVTASLAKVHDGKQPARPVGLLVINGTADPLVPYTGGEVRVLGRARGAIFSTDETVRRWAGFLGCTKIPTTQALPDAAPDDDTRPFASDWPGCQGAQVRLIRIQGGGHTWPGGRPYLPEGLVGRVCRDFAAVPVIFDFFAQHRRVATTIPGAPAPGSR